MTTFHVKTFGCQMNKHDSERVAGQLSTSGYKPIDDIEEADIIVFITCCVRKHADDRLYGNVDMLRSLKKKKPSTIIAVGGCLAQKDNNRMFEKLPHVDIVFGTYNQEGLIDMINEVRGGGRVLNVSEENIGLSISPALRQSKVHAWVPITIGCDNYCSYCIVPYVRGPERSYPIESIKKAVSDYVGEGVKEVTLLGQNVNSYGRDLYGKPRFTQLLDNISNTEGLERIRFTTSHPKDLKEDVIDIVKEKRSICSHFHLPVQSGSNRVLGDMKRGYSREKYIETALKIRSSIDDVSITTDIMVGFPTESEEDFLDTLDLVERVSFDHAYTFIYSEREGTEAANFKDEVAKEVKNDRFNRLVELQNKHCLESNKALVGRKLKVFVEGRGKRGKQNLSGRTDTNKLIHFSGDDTLINRFIDIKVDEAHSFYLEGEIV